MTSESHGRPRSVALVHDYVNQRGGGERVLLELAAIWPEAPIYTLAYAPASSYPEFRSLDVRTSFLDRVPQRRLRTMAPLYPAALRRLGELDHDLVISSSSGWSHLVRVAPGSTHVVYCHTLLRLLHAPEAYLGRPISGGLALPALRALRELDRRKARSAALYVANAENVRTRVREAYGIESEVVFPPVDTQRFTPRPRGERLLVVSRLFPYKRVDLAVEAANRAGIGLDVVGDGPSLDELRRLAGPTVTFHGRAEDATVTELMERCRAVCLPGVEDFGIVPVEANAAGKPAVVYAEGGALETQEDGVTAAFFHEPTTESLLEAIRRADALQTSPESLAESAKRFSRAAFRARFEMLATKALASRRDGYTNPRTETDRR